MSLSDSDIEEGMKKVSLAHEGYNIPTSTYKPEIEKFYDDIHTNIEELNQKLIGLFKKKEDDLCNMYKREMTKAQKRLRELQECTSETELNKRKIEKKEKLQKERQKFLETKFKNTLTKVVNTTKDLEAEINFLNEQIIFADKHNQKLSSELEQLKDEIHKYDPNAKLDNLEDVLSLPPKQRLYGESSLDARNLQQNSKSIQIQQSQQINNTSILTNNQGNNSIMQQNNQNNVIINNNSVFDQQQQGSTMSYNNNNNTLGGHNNMNRSEQVGKYISPYSKKQIMKPGGQIDASDLEKAKQELKRQKDINEKLSEFLNDPCFQETEFEKIFMDCVLTVKSKKQQQNQANKLPYVKNKDQPSSIDTSNVRGGGANDSTLDFTTISELDFNEFNKRQILEEFLSKEEIKKYLYTLIFSNNNNNGQNKSHPSANKNKPLQKDNPNSNKKSSSSSKQQNYPDYNGANNNNLLDELKK